MPQSMWYETILGVFHIGYDDKFRCFANFFQPPPDTKRQGTRVHVKPDLMARIECRSGEGL